MDRPWRLKSCLMDTRPGSPVFLSWFRGFVARFQIPGFMKDSGKGGDRRTMSHRLVSCVCVAGLCLLALDGAAAIDQGGALRRPDVRFLATPQNVVEAMLELAHVSSADVVFDLGSGDGLIPITAATKLARAASALKSIPTGFAKRRTTWPGPAWPIG